MRSTALRHTQLPLVDLLADIVADQLPQLAALTAMCMCELNVQLSTQGWKVPACLVGKVRR